MSDTAHKRPFGSGVFPSALAEAIGTFILVFAGTAVTGAALGKATAGAPNGSLGIALVFGFALVAVVGAFGHVSGAHVNPAVTLALSLTRHFPRRYVLPYIVAQVTGAIAASLAVWLLFGSAGRSKALLGAPVPAVGIGDFKVFISEVLITFILVIVVMAVATDERVPSTSTASLSVGFALAVAVFIAGPVSGGAANPARALGPEIVAETFKTLWAYVLGPLAGGLIAALVYDKLLRRGEAPGVSGETTSGS